MDELDAGVKGLLNRLEELKNSYQPIQRLHHDIIIEVATHLDPRACGGDCLPLVAMSQVCRYWREALLSNSESWSFISSKFTELVPLFLQRSGSSSLLEVHLSEDASLHDTIEHLGPHANRLAVLRCGLEEADITSLVALSRLEHSPNLQTFSITIRRPPTTAPEEIHMPLVSDEMPRFRKLELLPFPLLPQFTKVTNLTDVRLDVRYSTLTRVLDFLGANPSLERVRLLGNFEDDDDTRPEESIFMGRLRFFTVERCTPCLFLEKLTFPQNARIFIRYGFVPHTISFAYTLPRSVGRYTNLQDLSSLHALVRYPNYTYLDAAGPNGSVAIGYMELQDEFALSAAIATLPTAAITRLVCEFDPAFTTMSSGRFVRIMDALPLLGEIKLVHFGGADMQNLLSALMNTSEWTDLRGLEFVHCRQTAEWVTDLVRVASGRMDAGKMLDSVKVVFGRGEWVELFDVLGAVVGTLVLVEEGAGQILKSVQEWDDANCTVTTISVPVQDD